MKRIVLGSVVRLTDGREAVVAHVYPRQHAEPRPTDKFTVEVGNKYQTDIRRSDVADVIGYEPLEY